jgi:enoyl-CoA hydratase/carnithine racemase
MPEPVVLYEKQDGIGWVTLNRPEVLNAINLEMRDLLWEILQAIRDDPDARVAVILGAGDRAFSAGADVTEFGTAPSYLSAREARRNRDLWGLMLAMDKPLIAALHGYAYGAGCEMSLCCDFRVAADDTRLALPEVRLGYIPSAGGTQLLPRTIGLTPALQLILTGEEIAASEALQRGLVHTIVTPARLLDAAGATARELIRLPQQALRRAKQALRASSETALPAGLQIEASLALVGLSVRAID